MTLFLIVLLAALAFEYINGFHDTANAIATVVSTKVLSPRQAILLATVANLIGAFMGLSHGTNDAQKTMGIIALALFTGTSSGAFAHLPPWLGFLQTPEFKVG